jgi:hypothetical protein
VHLLFFVKKVLMFWLPAWNVISNSTVLIKLKLIELTLLASIYLSCRLSLTLLTCVNNVLVKSFTLLVLHTALVYAWRNLSFTIIHLCLSRKEELTDLRKTDLTLDLRLNEENHPRFRLTKISFEGF